MVQVTVFLLRCGETQVEAADHNQGSFVGDESNELVELGESGGSLTYSESGSFGSADKQDDSVKNGETSKEDVPLEVSESEDESFKDKDSKTKLRLSQRVDPFLTDAGFQQAQQVVTHLMQGLADSTKEERRMAVFCAPTKYCTETALMLSCARWSKHDNLRWQLATVHALQAPCAVPIVIHNTLVAAEHEVARCGGHGPVVDAGLLHCAAEPWNDARNKCPFAHVLKQMKGQTKDHVRAWKELGDKRRCIDVQYMRVEDPSDPWSLCDLTQKTNILIDLIDPKRYMTPPRKGHLAPKLQEQDKIPGPEEAVQRAVLWARQVGCDAVIFVVGPAAMQELAKMAGLLGDSDELDVPPCSLASLVAEVPDDYVRDEDGEGDDEDGGDAFGSSLPNVDFAFHGFFTADELEADPSVAIPPYTGPVDTIVAPPEGNDPMTVPVNQWSKFPPPFPENIPDDYPDLPPFSQALTAPVPKRPRFRPPPPPPPESAPPLNASKQEQPPELQQPPSAE